MNVPVTEAKARFAELLRRAEAGEEIVITRHGKPVAKLRKEPDAPARKLGRFADKPFALSDDFDELGPEWDEYTG